ncbi:MAG TPA: hypothetical protein VFL80_07515 [Thermoanaerobaculia bacterium]|nr:hypothetical protein [Thermoanaerobaculia bacterium]
MNGAYLHLIVNHFPPIMAIASIIVLATGSVWRRGDVRRMGVLLVVLAAATSVPTYFSGEAAEELVEGLADANHAAIEPHEDAAKIAFGLMIAAGVAALAALFVFRAERELPAWAIAAILVLTLTATAAAIRTALLGGRIKHPEIMMRSR